MRLLDPPQGVEFYRLRMDRWRILYAVNEEKGWIWVLAIRRRPPYDYTDLSELSRKLR
jgi:mRNA interferase RelE/StbE